MPEQTRVVSLGCDFFRRLPVYTITHSLFEPLVNSDVEARQCKPVGSYCNSLVPDCGLEQGNGVKSETYCGTDCQLYRVDQKLPDIIAPTEQEVKERMYFQQKVFNLQHCGVQEGSVKAPDGITADDTFTRRMLFFDTNTHNLGESFQPPPPDRRPDLFVWGECHGHFHFTKYAKFLLRGLEGEAATDDRFVKLAYCMEDSQQYLSGPNIPCYATGTCEAQTISQGWSDNYYFDLDGQWIDRKFKTFSRYHVHRQEISSNCIFVSAVR